MGTLSVSVHPGETRVLFSQNGEPRELFHDRMTCWPDLGTIVEGRVEEVKPSLGGAFIGLGRGTSGFLPRRAWPNTEFRQGHVLPLRVTRTAHDDKPARLSAHLNLPDGLDLQELQSLNPSSSVIFAAGLADAAQSITANNREWCEQYNAYCRLIGLPSMEAKLPLEDCNPSYLIDDAIQTALEPSIPLPSGGAIHITETRACTTIDVDSASANLSSLQVNLTAATVIAKALRLRGIGGLVVIDFIDMKAKADQNRVEKALRQAMKGDREPSDILPISRLGLLELSRPRRSPNLQALYCGPMGQPTPEAASFAAIRQVEQAMEHSRSPGLRAIVAPEVRDWLRDHPDILKQIETHMLKPVDWQAEPGRALHKVDIDEI